MYKKEEEKLMDYLTMHIKNLRNERKLSQNAFSELLCVYREHYAKVETRKRNLTLKLLFRISISLNIPLKDLFDFDIPDDITTK